MSRYYVYTPLGTIPIEAEKIVRTKDKLLFIIGEYYIAEFYNDSIMIEFLAGQKGGKNEIHN